MARRVWQTLLMLALVLCAAPATCTQCIGLPIRWRLTLQVTRLALGLCPLWRLRGLRTLDATCPRNRREPRTIVSMRRLQSSARMVLDYLQIDLYFMMLVMPAPTTMVKATLHCPRSAMICSSVPVKTVCRASVREILDTARVRMRRTGLCVSMYVVYAIWCKKFWC